MNQPTDPGSKVAGELDRIHQICSDPKRERIAMMLERQFGVLHARAQVLLGLCGIVITTTGFSGRLIAGTNLFAQVLIIAGVMLVMVAAIMVVSGVLHLNWLTQHPGEDFDAWVLEAISTRDRKTRAYRWSIVLLMWGIALYVIAMAIMLLHPMNGVLPPAR